MASSRGAPYQGTRPSRVRITTGSCRVGKRRACQERALATGFRQESFARPHMEPRPRWLHHSRHQGLPTLQEFRQHPPSCAPGPIMRRHPFELLVGDYLSLPKGFGSYHTVGLYQYFTLPGLFHVESMDWGMDSIPFPGGFHNFFRWIPYYFHMESRWNKFLAT